MPTVIKISILLFVMTVMQACTQKYLRVDELSSDHTGVIVQSLNIKNNNKHTLIVCYSEIIENKISGISCQNDTGLPLFSGGMKNNEFELEKVTRFLFNVKPQTILSYLKISLFSEYHIDSKRTYDIKITKNKQATFIQDFENKRDVEIKIL